MSRGWKRPSTRTDRRRLALALTAALALAQPAAAQDPAPLSVEEIYALTAEAERLMAEGDFDGAFAKIAVANDATFDSQAYDSPDKNWPNLVFVRYYAELGDWAETMRFASSIASALDADGYAGHPYRTEALLYQGIAAYNLGQKIEAERLLLRSFKLTEADPALAAQHQRAAYWTARVLSDIESPDAAEYRARFFALDLSGGPVTNEQTAYIVYQEIYARRLAGQPDGLVEQMEYLVAQADSIEGFSAEDRNYYRGYLGLIYAEAGRYDEALPLFVERHDFMLANEMIDDEFFLNVQRRGMLMSILGDSAGARAFAKEMHEFGKARNASPYMLGMLSRDMGIFSQELGQKAVAQLHFRNAYAEYRRVLRANHPDVQAVKRQIDLTARDIRSFSLAPELGVVDHVDFALDRSAADVIRMFFQGDYLTLDAVLADKEAEAGTAVFQVNLALARALEGDYGACMAALAEARRLVFIDPAGTIRPGDPVLDLIEAVALVWTSAHRRGAARPVLDGLAARKPLLSDGERSMYLALEIFYAFQSGDSASVPAAFQAWHDDWSAGAARDAWGVAAATLAVESSVGAVPNDVMDQVIRTTEADIAALGGTMDLARDYMRMVRLLNGNDSIFADTALTELGVLLNSIALQVPEDHGMISATQFGMAMALRWRNRMDEAKTWLQLATNTIRSNPWHAVDTLAFLISEMALIEAQGGDTGVAAALAKEAYDMIDLATARQDLSSAVVETYAYAIWQRTGDAAKAAAIYRAHVEDEAYFSRIAPLYQVRLLKALADALSSDGATDEVVALLDRAQAILDADRRDTRQDRSGVLWTRAVAEYFSQDYAAAFGHMRDANDQYYGWVADQVAKGAYAGIAALEAQQRAGWEAAIGWEYAQTLAE